MAACWRLMAVERKERKDRVAQLKTKSTYFHKVLKREFPSRPGHESKDGILTETANKRPTRLEKAAAEAQQRQAQKKEELKVTFERCTPLDHWVGTRRGQGGTGAASEAKHRAPPTKRKAAEQANRKRPASDEVPHQSAIVQNKAAAAAALINANMMRSFQDAEMARWPGLRHCCVWQAPRPLVLPISPNTLLSNYITDGVASL